MRYVGTTIDLGPTISFEAQPRAYLKQVNFLKSDIIDYWKIAGLGPAIFSGTPGNFEA